MTRARTARRRLAAVVALLLAMAVALPAPAAAFDGFGETSAEADFGDEITFEVELEGGAPDELELLLRFGDDDVTFVQPVEPEGSRASFTWDVAEDYIAPNTPIHHRWRATTDDRDRLSREATILYDDDRPELDWEIAESDEARVHWYSGEEALAERFAEITSNAVERAESLFGAELADSVDIFAYASEDDFFGALDLGPREWVGGQASSEIRTIYIRLDAGGESYMEPLLIHEVTHIVFDDATDNPYHGPARWLDEGLAVWAETQEAADERAIVEAAAQDGELMAFDAIAEQFPIEDARARLAYAQSASLVDTIITTHGADSIARLTAAYREGATDAAAIEAATGVPLDEIISDWFAELGQEVPQPIEPQPLLPADEEPPAGTPGSEPERPEETASDTTDPGPGETEFAPDGGLVILVVLGGLITAGVLIGGVVLLARRGAGAPPGGARGEG